MSKYVQIFKILSRYNNNIFNENSFNTLINYSLTYDDKNNINNVKSLDLCIDKKKGKLIIKENIKNVDIMLILNKIDGGKVFSLYNIKKTDLNSCIKKILDISNE